MKSHAINEIVDDVSKRLELHAPDVREVLHACINSISDALLSGKRVVLTGLGSIYATSRQGHIFHNAGGETVFTDRHVRLIWRTSERKMAKKLVENRDEILAAIDEE